MERFPALSSSGAANRSLLTTHRFPYPAPPSLPPPPRPPPPNPRRPPPLRPLQNACFLGGATSCLASGRGRRCPQRRVRGLPRTQARVTQSSLLLGDRCLTQGASAPCQSDQGAAPLHPLPGERRMLATSPAEGEGSSAQPLSGYAKLSPLGHKRDLAAAHPTQQRGRPPPASVATCWPLGESTGPQRTGAIRAQAPHCHSFSESVHCSQTFKQLIPETPRAHPASPNPKPPPRPSQHAPARANSGPAAPQEFFGKNSYVRTRAPFRPPAALSP